MSFVDTNTDDWSNYIGPNGVPRIDVTPKQQLKEYEDLKYYADKLPVQGQAAPTTYIMEPDLVETQTGKVHTPPDVSFDDAGFAYNNVTGEPVQIIRRPNVLPIARTPDGYTFAMPKILDAASNIVGGVAAPAVATKAGEVVLGSGAVKTLKENPFIIDAYHGTNQNIEKFLKAKPNESATNSTTQDLGIWLTDNPSIAGKYADNAAKNLIPNYNEHNKKLKLLQKEVERTERIGDWTANEKAIQALENHEYGAINADPSGQNIMPLKLALKNPLELDAQGGTMLDLEKSHGDIRTLIQNAKKEGKDGVIFKNLNDNPSLGDMETGTHYVVFDPKNIRSKFAKFDPTKFDKNGLLLSDTRNQVYGQIGHQIEKQNQPFYSGLERAVDAAKVNKADASQWLGYLKNQPGVKADEIGQVLKDLPQGPITKDQLQNIVQQNKVQLNEVVKGTDNLYGDKANYALNQYRQELLDKYGNGIRNKATPEELAKLDELDNRTTLRNPNPTKYHDYQLPGGENYQEMLLTLPEKLSTAENEYGNAAALIAKGAREKYGEQWLTNPDAAKTVAQYDRLIDQAEMAARQKSPPYKSSHWDESNILAHVRYNDRNIPDVGKSLHLEEIQSDWHQAGRKQGYKTNDELEALNKKGNAALDELEAANNDAQKLYDSGLGSYDEITKAEKRVDDAKALYDSIQKEYETKTKGVPDAPFKKTWDELAFKRMLHKAANEGYDSISWTPGEAQAARYDLSKQISKITYNAPGSKAADKYGTVLKAYDHNGHEVINKAAKPEELTDLIGKEAAEKLLKTEAKNDKHELAGLDLKVGGEGMKSFYDKMLVDKANALGKKYGAKVETKNLKPKIDESVGYENHLELKYGSNYKNQMTTEETKILNDLKNIKGQPVHVLKLTPELRAKAKEGFPMFSFTPTLSPVQHNPFEQDKKKYKLTPVQGNPFND